MAIVGCHIGIIHTKKKEKRRGADDEKDILDDLPPYSSALLDRKLEW